MLRDAAVNLLMARLGQRTDASLKDQIIAEMSFAQEQILEANATQFWFQYAEDVSLVTVASTETVALPTDFLIEYEDGGLYVVDTTGKEHLIDREDWDTIRTHVSLSGEGQPTHYDLLGDNIHLRKIPDNVYSLKLQYFAKQADISGVLGDGNNIENGWLKHAADLLMAETGTIIAGQYIQSESMIQLFGAQKQVALDRLIKKDTAWKESNKLRKMEG